MIYFDNAATTKPYEELRLNLYELSGLYNPSSPHELGQLSERLLTSSRKAIAEILKVLPSEIIFTSGGTESNNLLLTGLANAYVRKGNEIITTTAEHSSVEETLTFLEGCGFKVTRLLPGQLTKLEQFITEKTIIVSVMHVNNETGDIFDVESLGEMLHKRGILLHCDGVQGFCKEPISLKYIDAYSFSAHKIHGLKGSGGFYLKSGTKLKPLFHGGEQEEKIRPGTENVLGINTMAAASVKAFNSVAETRVRVSSVKEYITNGLSDLAVENSIGKTSPYILNLSFKDAKSSVLLQALDEQSIYVSSGSACNARSNKKAGETLVRMGFDKEKALSALRLSFSFENTLQEAEMFIKHIRQIIEKYCRKR